MSATLKEESGAAFDDDGDDRPNDGDGSLDVETADPALEPLRYASDARAGDNP